MSKNLWIIAIIIFVAFIGLFLRSQIPVTITQDEVFAAIDDAIAQTGVQVDETDVEQAVKKAISNLEAGQKRRLRFLVCAYFIVWLIFMLYTLRLSRSQDQLRQRLDRLESD